MTQPTTNRSSEEGYLLIGLVVVCFLLLLALSVAAPRVSKELERDREVESEHRALEYVRAIQLYYKKNGAYPTSIEQLLGSGTTGAAIAGPGSVKYLRQAYKDPLTKDEYRLIHVNEAQTQVKSFFGEPLPGMAPGIGGIGGVGGTSAAAAGMGGSTPGSAITSTIGGSTPGNTINTSIGGQTPGSTITSTVGGSTPGSTIPGSTVSTPGTGTSGTSSSSSTDATTFQGSKGGIVGVGSNAKGHGLVEWNGSEDIDKWEFLYDPRVEQLKAKVSVLGGAPAANGSGSLGNGFAPAAGINAPATGAPATGTSGTSGTSSGTGSGTTGTSSGTTPPTQ